LLEISVRLITLLSEAASSFLCFFEEARSDWRPEEGRHRLIGKLSLVNRGTTRKSLLSESLDSEKADAQPGEWLLRGSCEMRKRNVDGASVPGDWIFFAPRLQFDEHAVEGD
jgi:hypothetical protein